MKTFLAAGAVVALAVTASASAGTTLGPFMDLSITHTGEFGESVGGEYAYGTVNAFADSFDFSWTAFSPAGLDGFDFSIAIDFADFNLNRFQDDVAGVIVQDIEVDIAPDSLVLLNSDFEPIGFNMSSGGGTGSGQYHVNDILDADGTTLYIAWDAAPVPGPGAAALLGAAGLCGLRRRRR